MPLVDAITQFGGEVEQDARTQFLAVQARGFGLACMDRAAEGEGKECLPPRIPIPVEAEIERAGLGYRRSGTAAGR